MSSFLEESDRLFWLHAHTRADARSLPGTGVSKSVHFSDAVSMHNAAQDKTFASVHLTGKAKEKAHKEISKMHEQAEKLFSKAGAHDRASQSASLADKHADIAGRTSKTVHQIKGTKEQVMKEAREGAPKLRVETPKMRVASPKIRVATEHEGSSDWDEEQHPRAENGEFD